MIILGGTIPIEALVSFAALFLLYFSWKDLQKREVDNEPIVALLVMGLFAAFINHNLSTIITLTGFMGLCAYCLWNMKTMGGADAKVLIALAPFIYSFYNLAYFFMILAFVSIAYVNGYIYITGKKKRIPFIPAIAISYLLTFILI